MHMPSVQCPVLLFKASGCLVLCCFSLHMNHTQRNPNSFKSLTIHGCPGDAATHPNTHTYEGARPSRPNAKSPAPLAVAPTSPPHPAQPVHPSDPQTPSTAFVGQPGRAYFRNKVDPALIPTILCSGHCVCFICQSVGGGSAPVLVPCL